MSFGEDLKTFVAENKGFDTGGKYAVLGLALCTIFLELIEEMFGLVFTKDFQSALLVVATFAIAYFMAPTGNESWPPVEVDTQESQRVFLETPPLPEESKYPRQSNVSIVPKPIKETPLPEKDEE